MSGEDGEARGPAGSQHAGLSGPGALARPRPHDLLAIRSAGSLVTALPPPPWVADALAGAAVVVVRREGPLTPTLSPLRGEREDVSRGLPRAELRGALIPVGVRGQGRGDRFGAWVAPDDVTALVTPEDLAARRAWRDRPAHAPALDALDAVELVMAGAGLAWGPAGSAGFELATGVRCLHAESDLDLVVRAPRRLAPEDARALLAALAALTPCRIDVQLETPEGAVALGEWASGAREVVLRTCGGPRLVADPWRPA